MPRSDKLTKNQAAILGVLQELKEPISAQELYRVLHSRGKVVGLATVYRSLDALKLQGSIKSASAQNGESLYSPAPIDRHHLHCLHCGLAVPIHCCPVTDIVGDLKQSYDFQVYYHTLEFFGVCQQCQQEMT